MEGAVKPIMPGVFEDKEDGNLISYFRPWWEWYIGVHAEIFAHGVKEPDLR